MKVTNRHDLPQPFVSAITNDPYVKVGNISVSSLNKSPRQYWLERRHDDEIEIDASERVWPLLGSVGHKILERANTDNHLTEERMTAEVNGWVLSGQPDLLGPDGTLDDYKFTSVWAMKEAKPEWEQQLNCYAWLYHQHGFGIRRLRIIAILRDWSKRQAQREPDYPQVGVVVREVPLWDEDQQGFHIESRIFQFRDTELLHDNALPECTPAERWQRPDMWAVKKKGNKRALRVYDNEAEAITHNNTSNNLTEIEFRPGENVKCESYCPVQQFCSQYAAIKAVK